MMKVGGARWLGLHTAKPLHSRAGVSCVSPERHSGSLSIHLMCPCMHGHAHTRAHAHTHRPMWVGPPRTSGLVSVLSPRLRESEPLGRHHLNEGDSLPVSRWPQDYFRSAGSRGCHSCWRSSSCEEKAGPLCCSYALSPCPGKGLRAVLSCIS